MLSGGSALTLDARGSELLRIVCILDNPAFFFCGMKDSHVQGHQPKSCTHRKSMRVVTKGSVITQTSCGCGWPSATGLFSWSAVRLLVNTMICMIYSSESRQRWLYVFLAQLQLKAQVY